MAHVADILGAITTRDAAWWRTRTGNLLRYKRRGVVAGRERSDYTLADVERVLHRCASARAAYENVVVAGFVSSDWLGDPTRLFANRPFPTEEGGLYFTYRTSPNRFSEVVTLAHRAADILAIERFVRDRLQRTVRWYLEAPLAPFGDDWEQARGATFERVKETHHELHARWGASLERVSS